jgi:integrase
MGRIRKAITLDRISQSGDRYFCYLKHPVRKTVVNFSLGFSNEVTTNLEKLNKLYLNEEYWFSPPTDIPQRIREQWLGPDGVLKLRGDSVRQGKQVVQPTSVEMAAVLAENEALKHDNERLHRIIEQQGRELEALRGKKYRKGIAPTLKDACDTWLKKWRLEKRDRNPEYVKTVTWDLQRFVEAFGASKTIDKLDGAEQEINEWLHGLKKPVERDEDGNVTKSIPISPSRLMQLRVYVVKFLTESGVDLKRKNIARPSKKELKASRGGIRWLTREQAESLLKVLPAPFADALRIQVAIGLRPNELLTLHASQFENDYAILHLQPLDALRLKTGPRTIPIPEDLRPVLRWRAQQNDVLFPDPKTKKAFADPKLFTRQFKAALVEAAVKAKPRIRIELDSRVGRRTCASLLIQANVSAEKVAALLGNSAAMILDHYGDPDIKKLDLGPTTLGSTEASLPSIEQRFCN